MIRHAIPPVDVKRTGDGVQYMTAGKPYKIIDMSDTIFYIINDIGGKNVCLFRNCNHLLYMGCTEDYQIAEDGVNV